MHAFQIYFTFWWLFLGFFVILFECSLLLSIRKMENVHIQRWCVTHIWDRLKEYNFFELLMSLKIKENSIQNLYIESLMYSYSTFDVEENIFRFSFFSSFLEMVVENFKFELSVYGIDEQLCVYVCVRDEKKKLHTELSIEENSMRMCVRPFMCVCLYICVFMYWILCYRMRISYCQIHEVQNVQFSNTERNWLLKKNTAKQYGNENYACMYVYWTYYTLIFHSLLLVLHFSFISVFFFACKFFNSFLLFLFRLSYTDCIFFFSFFSLILFLVDIYWMCYRFNFITCVSGWI